MKQLNFLIFIFIINIIMMNFVSGKLMSEWQRSIDSEVLTAKIIKSCYRETVKEIGLVGNLSDSLIASIMSDDLTVGVLRVSDEGLEENGAVSRWFRNKLQIFVITTKSSVELKKMLVDIKNSRWWNHMANFYIFGSSGEERRCTEAFGYLWTAWTMDILGAKFVCNDDVDGTLIYTFNPYTEYAPEPWTLVETHQGLNNHSWVLLVRKHLAKMNICENVDIDATKNVGGHEVRLTASRNIVYLDYKKTGNIYRYKEGNTILRKISHYLNITFELVLWENEPLGSIDKNGKGHDRVGDLVDARSDIIFMGVSLTTIPELPRTYPFTYQKFFSVTQYTAFLTQWQKLASAIDYSSRIAVGIVMLMNIFFFKYVLRQSYMIAILNTVRMICNSCFTKLPNNLALRIYLVGLFCFVIVIQALFQGQLSALLAKHIRLSNINNNRDLLHSDYKIYGWRHLENIFSHPALKERFVGINIFDVNCTDYVLLNPKIACVGSRTSMINNAIKFKLHMSKHPVLEAPVAFLLRKNWPLEERLNRHFSHYLESGLFNYDYEESFAHEQRTLAYYENRDNDESFKILTASDFNFAFVILAIGLACATICFFGECYFGKKRSFKVKYPSRYRR